MKYVDSEFWRATERFMHRLSCTIERKLEQPVKAYLSGDAAFHYYTGERNPHLLDLSFSRNFLVPQNIYESYMADGVSHQIQFNFKHSPISSFIFHEYLDQASPIGIYGENQNIELFVLPPIDLAVSKLSCHGDKSINDIARLATIGGFDAETFQQHAKGLLDQYLGNKSTLHEKIEHACNAIRH